MYTFAPIAAAIGFAATVTTVLTALFAPIAGASAAALAVVALTVLVRLAVHPLSRAAVRGEKQRARLAPEMRRIQEKHAGNPQRLAEAQQQLFQKEGTTPLAGCLPMLAQTPVFLVLYGLFISPEVSGGPNTLLAETLAGVPLGDTLSAAAGGSGIAGAAVFAVLMAVAAAAAWGTRQWLTLPAMQQNAAGPAGAGQPQLPGMGVMTYLPFMTVAIVAFVPLAAGLYLATSTVWSLAERLYLRAAITV
ncbi:YidC/Oxa1 family membrane protein insertase [Nocardiopsis coralliicola]